MLAICEGLNGRKWSTAEQLILPLSLQAPVARICGIQPVNLHQVAADARHRLSDLVLPYSMVYEIL